MGSACGIAVLQGPKENAAEELWLVTKGLVEVFGGMDDGALEPSDGI